MLSEDVREVGCGEGSRPPFISYPYCEADVFNFTRNGD